MTVILWTELNSKVIYNFHHYGFGPILDTSEGWETLEYIQYYTLHLEFGISVKERQCLVGLLSDQTSIIHEVSQGDNQGTSFKS